MVIDERLLRRRRAKGTYRVARVCEPPNASHLRIKRDTLLSAREPMVALG